jgi:hypothetical protein
LTKSRTGGRKQEKTVTGEAKENRQHIDNVSPTRKAVNMEKQKKTEKTDPLPPEKKYVYYVLCRKCHAVNVADPPGVCSKCLRNEPPRDNFRPKKNADYRTKLYANKCGALPWVYRGRREDKELCFLQYGKWEISVQRQPNRLFCYIVKSKDFSVFRKNITELVFARTRSVRHLARILDIPFNELCDRIKNQPKGK